MPHRPDDEPRYTDEELSLILRDAAQRQVRAEDAGERSLSELQEIAAEAGIAPSHVAEAAAALRSASPAAGRDRAGARFAYRLTLPGALTASQRERVLDVARRSHDGRGSVREEGDALVWTMTDGFGVTRVAVASGDGTTTLDVAEDRTQALGAARIAGAIVGVALAMVLAPVLFLGLAGPGGSLLAGALAALAAGVLPALGLGWLAARLARRRIAAKWQARTQALGEELAAAARPLLAGGTKRGRG